MSKDFTPLETPVAFFVYRRPDYTRRSFDSIRAVKPKKLFIIADGPKNKEEQDECRIVRSIVENIDWPCEVKKNYSLLNLGLRNRIFSGLDWVFSQTNQAILLENDVIADPSFFYFCQELLVKYETDEKIFNICGSNLFSVNNDASYYFSRLPISPFASAMWRRSWQLMDIGMKKWQFITKKKLRQLLNDNKRSLLAKYYFKDVYQGINSDTLNDWVPELVFSIIINGAGSIIPTTNLVTNIGIDEAGTNVKEKMFLTNIPITPMKFPLSHPKYLIFNEEVTDRISEWAYHMINNPHSLRSLKIQLAIYYFISKINQ